MSGVAGLRVLVVEDEPIVAMCLEDMLVELGCQVVGPAATLADGLARAQDTSLDLAVLDINLGGATSYPIAQLLSARAVPIVFASGYGRADAPDSVQAELVSKPYTRCDIESALARAMGGQG